MSFKGKQVHVAQEAAGPHAEQEHPMDGARSKPARTQEKLSLAKGQGYRQHQPNAQQQQLLNAKLRLPFEKCLRIVQ